MSWLPAVILVASLAHGQPPAPVIVAAPQRVEACAPTEFPVTVDNAGHPVRDIQLDTTIDGGAGLSLEFQLPAGTWQRLTGSTTPQVTLAAGERHEFRFRAAFPQGGHTIRVRVIDPRAAPVPAAATTQITATGPELHVRRPIPEASAADGVEFGVTLRDQGGESALSLQIRSDTAPDINRTAAGATVEVSTRQGPWQPVELSSWHGWYGRVDIGRLAPGEERDLRVRVRAPFPAGQPMPVDVRMVNGVCVAAADGFGLVWRDTPVRPGQSGRMFVLGLGSGAGGGLVVLLLWRVFRRTLRRRRGTP